MKKIVLVFIAFASVSAVFAQEKKPKKKIDLANRAGDHLMLQLGSDTWMGVPDSIKSHKKGLSRGGNIYVMMDKPFKNNPRFSAGFGIGIGTSNMYFKNYSIDIKSTSTKLPFISLDSADRFKKYKISTAFLEVPVELRFTADPEKSSKSLKAAIGVKVGTLINVHTKGKILQNKNGGTINSYTEKINNKRYFNTTRLAITGRIGYGNFSLFGSYQVNNLLKDGVGPDIKPLQIGICVSGL
jgi:Outer membrane protein beta-barrel domain